MYYMYYITIHFGIIPSSVVLPEKTIRRKYLHDDIDHRTLVKHWNNKGTLQNADQL